jgi:flagellar hook-length control protein FliK
VIPTPGAGVGDFRALLELQTKAVLLPAATEVAPPQLPALATVPSVSNQTEAVALTEAATLAPTSAPRADLSPQRKLSDGSKDHSDTDLTPELQTSIAAMVGLPWPTLPVPMTCTTSAAATVDDAVSAANANTGVAQNVVNGAAALPALVNAAAAPERTTAGDAAQIARVDVAGMMAIEPYTDKHNPGGDADSNAAGQGNSHSADHADSGVIAELRSSFSAFMEVSGATASRAERSIGISVHDARWPTAVSNEVAWCAQNGVQTATLKLAPENLGPVQLRVDLDGKHVNVNFTAAHLETREALESSLPRLRELLASSGLTLGQASVQQEARRESHSAAAAARSEGESPAAELSTPLRLAIGLVDAYA